MGNIPRFTLGRIFWITAVLGAFFATCHYFGTSYVVILAYLVSPFVIRIAMRWF